jgi:hypothetical protein
MARAATGPIPARPHPPGERRRAGARQPMEALGVLTEFDGDKQLQVTVCDISPDGCCFRSPVPFRPGTRYSMRIGTGPLYLASTLDILASRARSDGTFDVGARFA